MGDPVARVGVGIGVCYVHPGLGGLPGLAAAVPQQLGRSSTGFRADHAIWSLRTRSLAAARGLGVSEKEAGDATCENQDLLAGGFGAYPRIAIALLFARLSGRVERGLTCSDLRYLIWNGG